MIFPSEYVSLVSSKFAYLLSLPNDVCTLSTMEYGARYDGGILCKVPLRALKIYTRDITSGNAPSLHIDIWANSLGVHGQTGTPDASQDISFHQIGGDGETRKQGFSVPVIPGTTYSYHISLNTGDRVIPNSWIIEFSDPVMGNRWEEELIQLAVQGRNCGEHGMVSSQHDRRFLWSGDDFIDDDAWGNHGACVSSLSLPPDMPTLDCSSNQGLVGSAECPDLCLDECDNGNSFCHCGTATCQCKSGFGGIECSVDLCAAARCSEHGKCAAQYLGSSSILPVINSNSACICDVGWSGPLCDSNPCEAQGRVCSGHGTCHAISEIDTVCICVDGYSGENCETSCDGYCQGNGGVYPYSCATNLDGVVAYQCGPPPNGGCAYQTDPTATGPAGFCTYKSTSASIICECPNDNDCMIAGTCIEDGICSDATLRDDGTPCNSVPFGVCQNGFCMELPTPFPTHQPTKSPFETNSPTRSSIEPPTNPPTEAPVTSSPTTPPTIANDPYDMKDCSGVGARYAQAQLADARLNIRSYRS
mmetsp:Transcript_13603/g.20143  ORF Transcript_13603/g.20143 Transcript_13603/m.20143 type:complete len:532 (-) Transcript_13603:129-1724(-)